MNYTQNRNDVVVKSPDVRPKIRKSVMNFDSEKEKAEVAEKNKSAEVNNNVFHAKSKSYDGARSKAKSHHRSHERKSSDQGATAVVASSPHSKGAPTILTSSPYNKHNNEHLYRYLGQKRKAENKVSQNRNHSGDITDFSVSSDAQMRLGLYQQVWRKAEEEESQQSKSKMKSSGSYQSNGRKFDHLVANGAQGGQLGHQTVGLQYEHAPSPNLQEGIRDTVLVSQPEMSIMNDIAVSDNDNSRKMQSRKMKYAHGVQQGNMSERGTLV